MSLDVYLTLPNTPREQSGSGIFIREDGQTKEISRDEWDTRYPGREPVVVSYREGGSEVEVYHANITHNLNKMASEAGVYFALWRPEEINITAAGQLIPLLRDGLATLQTEPERFLPFNPPNGWGDYDGLIRFVADYLAACERYPTATIEVSR